MNLVLVHTLAELNDVLAPFFSHTQSAIALPFTVISPTLTFTLATSLLILVTLALNSFKTFVIVLVQFWILFALRSSIVIGIKHCGVVKYRFSPCPPCRLSA